ncbi:preprotein translocase subunit SecD [Clavibacter michiganensis]|uniref:protein translocase subunit SecD n=1 Tax=Clavibacter michiganensis TaxID=28447 RepID=UPI001AE578A6|nr:protein translocase subunit SecD [Clavibacter michiganensis]MBP2458529.1 preprotein translocase subunit SecD [Clavibacter michiganensis]MDQ0411100.1 preprotein translocase subunit SecD [Clavibacter michiganensis]
MAKSPTPVRKARRKLIWLLVIIGLLAGGNAASVAFSNGSWTPKLALDLEGGTQIILAPQLDGASSGPTSEQLAQAVSIIRQRVDASGVSEAEITTQGGSNIVVSLPGEPDAATMQRLQSSAKLELRPVLIGAAGTASVAATPTPTATDGSAPADGTTPTDGSTPAAETPAAEATPDPSTLSDEPTAEPTGPSDVSWVTPRLQAEFAAYDCATAPESDGQAAPADRAIIACSDDGAAKYVLGPVEVDGSTISDATSGLQQSSQGVSTGTWSVNLVFDGDGTKQFGDMSTRLITLESPRNQFAFVLDNEVISAPVTQGVVTNGKPSITGNFTQESAKALADQLKFGALPLSFTLQSSDVISATLGSSQLTSGLIAGLIGLVLVVLYSLVQYRVLGTVTIASLVIAAVITYLLITLLSWREGYRLSLAGVAGLIVAIGITADSFIVYFERIKDELRDGRGLVSSVEQGWKRALRTIIASDTVNFLAAAVLFILAVGNVKGFALTLGLTTIIDLIVVSLFTHPILQLLANRPFFAEGHRMSGLDPRALGAVYRGRATFRTPTATAASGRNAAAAKEAARRQTIAERKATQGQATGSTKTATIDAPRADDTSRDD